MTVTKIGRLKLTVTSQRGRKLQVQTAQGTVTLTFGKC